MQKSSVIEIIKNFSEDDITKFNDFVVSPYFNKNKNVVKLFVEIKKNGSEFENEDLRKENLWRKIYPDKNFNYGVMKNLIYDLSKLLEEYIAINKFRDDKIQSDHYMIVGLYDNGNYDLFPKKYSSIEKKYKVVFSVDNVCHYYHIFSEIKHMNYVYKLNFKMDFDAPQEGERFMIYRVMYFLVAMFRDYTDHIISRAVIKIQSDKNDFIKLFFNNLNDESIDKFIDSLKNEFPIDHKILIVYRNMYLGYVNQNNVEYFKKFKNAVFDVKNIVSKLELRTLCIKLRNLLSILRSNKSGSKDLFIELSEICDFMIVQDIFVHQNGEISEIEFNNYVTNAVRLNNDAKLENFLLKYINKVNEPYKINAYNYGMANLQFMRKNFGDALVYIMKLVNNYTLLKLSIRGLQLKCYYELNDYEGFVSVYNSLKKFKTKNIFVLKNSKEELLKLCRNINTLFKIREDYNKYEFEIFGEKFTNGEDLEESWIRRKLDEIVKVNKKYKKHA